MKITTFPITNLSNITFLTVKKFISKRAEKINKEINTVTNLYKASGFNMDVYLKDIEFNINALREHTMPEIFNICAK